MSEFNEGDTVRVTFETAVRTAGDFPGYYLAWHTEVKNHVVEVIERADDPCTDPIGTVRVCGDEETWVHVKRDPAETAWRCAGQDLFEGNHRHMAGTNVVGATPSTPAWEAWRLGTLRGAPPFPFIDVDQVVPESKLRVFTDKDGEEWRERTPDSFTLYRRDGGWSTYYSHYTYEGLSQDYGPLTEVAES